MANPLPASSATPAVAKAAAKAAMAKETEWETMRPTLLESVGTSLRDSAMDMESTADHPSYKDLVTDLESVMASVFDEGVIMKEKARGALRIWLEETLSKTVALQVVRDVQARLSSTGNAAAASPIRSGVQSSTNLPTQLGVEAVLKRIHLKKPITGVVRDANFTRIWARLMKVFNLDAPLSAPNGFRHRIAVLDQLFVDTAEEHMHSAVREVSGKGYSDIVTALGKGEKPELDWAKLGLALAKRLNHRSLAWELGMELKNFKVAFYKDSSTDAGSDEFLELEKGFEECFQGELANVKEGARRCTAFLASCDENLRKEFLSQLEVGHKAEDDFAGQFEWHTFLVNLSGIERRLKNSSDKVTAAVNAATAKARKTGADKVPAKEEADHVAKSYKAGNQRPSKPDNKCRKCGQEGHWAKSCPKPEAGANGNDSSGGASAKGAGGRRRKY